LAEGFADVAGLEQGNDPAAVTGHGSALAGAKFRYLLSAHRYRLRAAGVERASGDRPDQPALDPLQILDRGHVGV